MPTPRHHLNRQRRRQALAEAPAPRSTGSEGAASRPSAAGRARTSVGVLTEPGPRTRPAPPAKTEEGATATAPRPRPLVPLVVLCVLTLLLGGFAGLAYSRAGELRDDPARGNTALTDAARTSEIKGQTAAAVAALFSYDHADPAPFERAGKTLLTGKAVEQHRTLLGGVLSNAAQQKSVITTTVTDSAVERIDGDRAPGARLRRPEQCEHGRDGKGGEAAEGSGPGGLRGRDVRGGRRAARRALARREHRHVRPLSRARPPVDGR
ncbi:integral membrane protein [Streptomyces venezuelae ATCC 10712]|uniref:Integral membrane protein n=1 Tax=Streptomyces venezuelae (strain ATCC 10712 / CBS 650.69 / DSM 40230 / JCM 4526 / NBRC 13096 / PD 04745) TaxID=953739 RepID=F2R9Y6_STRVP|nr:integral membrane protein [Streptomyces venezuelae ATCC 10712]